ncbi:MAG: LytTR family DNA-binding domain-containing protein [Pseudomonadota bacterium]
MDDTNDSPEHTRWATISGGWPILLLALSLATAWLTLDLGPERYVHPALLDVEVAQATGAHPPPQHSAAWERARWWELSHLAQARWLRFTLDRRDLRLTAPALALSGPFSAQVFVDGQLRGSKGTPGRSAAAEQPGPIDAAINLDLPKTERAVVHIRLSAFHARYEPARQFHALGLRNVTDDPRRRPDNYLLGMTQAGLLLALLVLFGGWAPRDPPARWVALAAAAALVALSAECCRIWINYPYPWQGVRQGVVWAGLAACGLALAAYVRRRFELPVLPIAIGAVLVLITFIALSGADVRTASGIAASLALTLVLLGQAPSAQRNEALRFAALLLPWPVIALTNAPAFLDNAAYLLISLAISLLAIETHNRVSRPAAGPTREQQTAQRQPASLALEGQRLALRDVVSLQAAGNYVEVSLCDGARGLYRASLSGAIEQAPSVLLRVHRSYAVNLDRARRLRSRKGSRYALELDDGSELPVGRSFVTAVRHSLSSRK